MISAAPLKGYMSENNVSLEELSMATGVSRESLTLFINGKCMSQSILNSLCKTLKLNVNQILVAVTECEICKQPLEDNFCPHCGRRII